VTQLRALLHRQPWLAALLLAAAMLLRLVPAGYMPVVAGGGITVALCPGYAPAKPMAGMAHHGSEHPEPPSPCAFADLALPALGGADPLQLAAAMLHAFAAALVLAALLPPRPRAHLRPPLRGPPLPR
jgi:hypothetical protein